MIERQNYLDCTEHLKYRREVCRDADSTLDTRWPALRWMLRGADDVLCTAAPTIRPTWTTWLGDQDRDGDGLATSTVEGMTSAVRVFFQWAMLAHPRRYRKVNVLYLDSLRPPERTYYTLADVEALAAVDGGSMRCRRVQAAAAMLFLSGMRSGAFVTLRIRCVDVAGRRVRQWVSQNVMHSDSATTDPVYMRLTGDDQADLIGQFEEEEAVHQARGGGRTRKQILADVAADIALLSEMGI